MKQLQDRYLALDVLRGLTLTLMIIVNSPGNETTSYAPFLHAAWHGMTLTDLVFPTFMFVVGTALSFTIDKYQTVGDVEFLKKTLTRTAFIFLLGFLLYWYPFFTFSPTDDFNLLPFANTRIFGVLQRIALGYCFASLILHFWKPRGAIIFSIAALLGYWGILIAFGDYTMNGNAGTFLDKLILGENHMYHGEGVAFDPEGILSTLPSIVNVIVGYFAGQLIRKNGANFEAIAKLLMAGAIGITIALCWGATLPINKKLWTSSYVLCTVGIDLVVLGILVYVIEIVRLRNWTYFFEVFGKNTLFIYLLSEVTMITFTIVHVGSQTLAGWLYMVVFRSWAGSYNGSLAFAVTFMFSCWLVAYIMDKKSIYIKL